VLTILVKQHVHSEHRKQLGTSYKHLNYEPALSTVDTLGQLSLGSTLNKMIIFQRNRINIAETCLPALKERKYEMSRTTDHHGDFQFL
jgi:hypothetical protein